MADNPSPLDRTALFRILDVNGNRAEEGMRVVEEYLRLVCEDRFLASFCKQLRHDLAAALGTLGLRERLAARDVRGDVGTEISTADESQRSSPRHVAWASQKRVEQALRALEEYGKIISASSAALFAQLRYQAYTLGRALEISANSIERLEHARLYVLIDGQATLDRFSDRARRLIDAGVDILQLRDKQLADRELLRRARRLRELTENSRCLFIMNDRPDLAVLANADGVHVGQDELTVKDARRILGPERLIGVSTHSLDQVQQAVLDGANYIGCGPTFPSQTKDFQALAGLEFLRQVAAETRLPAFAIGGIGLHNVASVRDSGFGRIAVGHAIAQAQRPAETVAELLDQLPKKIPKKINVL